MTTPQSPYHTLLTQTPSLKLLLPLIIGIYIAEQDLIPPTAIKYLLIITTSSLIIAALLLYRHIKRPPIITPLLYLSILTTGITTTLLAQQQSTTQWPSTPHHWQAIVIDHQPPTHKTHRIKVIVEGYKIQLAILKTAIDSLPKIGQAISFNSEIKEPYNYYQSEFDYARYLKRQSIAGQAFTYQSITYLDQSVEDSLINTLSVLDQLKLRALKTRQSLLQTYRNLNLQDKQLALLSAITLGEKSNLSSEIKTEFSKSGISHILALSGLHLSILIGFLLFIFQPLRLCRWGRWLEVVVLIVIIWGFALLSGLSLSIVRSGLMFSVMLLLQLRGEGFASLSNVTLAAIIILFFAPGALMDVGFQLSFISVGALVFYSPYYRLFSCRFRSFWVRGVLDFLYVSVVAQIATAPLVANVFHIVPIFSIAANVVAIPATYIILFSAVLFFLFCWQAEICSVLGFVLEGVTSIVLRMVEMVSALRFCCVECRPSSLTTVFVYSSLFTLSIFLLVPCRKHFYPFLLSLGLLATVCFWNI